MTTISVQSMTISSITLFETKYVLTISIKYNPLKFYPLPKIHYSILGLSCTKNHNISVQK